MGEVIEVKFGNERYWQEIEQIFRSKLARLGSERGYSQEFQDRVAKDFVTTLRECCEKEPPMQFSLSLPTTLSDDERAQVAADVTQLTKAACQAVYEHVIKHWHRNVLEVLKALPDRDTAPPR